MASAVRLPSLTGLRFFLALWVIVFHQSYQWWGFGIFGRGYLTDAAPPLPFFTWPVINTGYFAVSVFFTLSGFILSYNYGLDERWGLSRYIRYLVARFARIYPVYGLGLLMIAPFILYSYNKVYWIQGAIRQLYWNLGLAQSWNAYLATSWNFPAWSLSDEAFFYCCFPWVGMLFWRLSIRSGAVAVVLLWILAMTGPLGAILTGQHLNKDLFWSMLVQFNPVVRLPDFCTGIVLGRIYSVLVRRGSRWIGRGYYFYGAGLLLEGFAVTYGRKLPRLFLMDGLFTPIHALVILGLALGGGPLVRVLSTRLVVFLGNASYAMYILHAPLFLWMNYLAYKLYGIRLGGIADEIIYLGIVCLCSALVYPYFEKPANRFLRGRFNRRSASVAAAAERAPEPADAWLTERAGR